MYADRFDERNEHLREIFELGTRIRTLISADSAKWEFEGILDKHVVFPEVLRQGSIVRKREVDPSLLYDLYD